MSNATLFKIMAQVRYARPVPFSEPSVAPAIGYCQALDVAAAIVEQAEMLLGFFLTEDGDKIDSFRELEGSRAPASECSPPTILLKYPKTYFQVE